MRLGILSMLVVAACGGPATAAVLPPIDPSVSPVEVASLAELTAPGTFLVAAYVVSVPNCPPCEGPDPCAPCNRHQLHLLLSDGPPPIAALPDGFAIDPASRDVRAFEVGRRYRFAVSVERRPDGSAYVALLGAESDGPP